MKRSRSWKEQLLGDSSCSRSLPVSLCFSFPPTCPDPPIQPHHATLPQQDPRINSQRTMDAPCETMSRDKPSPTSVVPKGC